VFPPVAHLSTAYYEGNLSNEENVLSHLRSTEGLGFEVFWLDAHWTGPDGFPSSMGNYGLPLESVEPPDRFPHGLKPIADAAHARGMKFVLWFEPERVFAGTEIERDHPGYLLRKPGDARTFLLDLGNPGSFDSNEIATAACVWSEGKYFLYYTGRSGSAPPGACRSVEDIPDPPHGVRARGSALAGRVPLGPPRLARLTGSDHGVGLRIHAGDHPKVLFKFLQTREFELQATQLLGLSFQEGGE
jgi:hypothetical protein